jgi:hypothetical protein
MLVAAAAIGSVVVAIVPPAFAQDRQIDTLEDLFAAVKQCWRSPPLPAGNPGMQITVLMSFKRDGQLNGRPRITFESPGASDQDRLAYRIAVMQTLQRCSPLPITDGLGGAVAGRPLTMRFDDRRTIPKPTEKRAWLTTTTS